ncbi:uncharacterized protein PG986_013115 [Apiospora aurea]|uniref:Uncharacterized protein n=1 Tax=Apiospora aurea TaxID=335848 RepID=A0ABR1PUN9_9PEZI
MSFVLFRDAECGRPSPNQPTYLSLGTCLDVPVEAGSILVGTLPGCPNNGLPTLFISSNKGCAFPTETSGSGSGSGGGSGGGTYSGGGGGSSEGHNSSSTSGSGNEGEEGSGGSSSEGVGQSGGEYTSAPWYHPPPTFAQGSNAVAAQADAATGTEGFAGVNITGTCTQLKGQSIGSVQFACPEFARQLGPTATSTSGGGESLRVQSRSRSCGAVWWTLMGGWVVLGLLGGG